MLKQAIEHERSEPFDGLLGFSEGGCVAATIILHHIKNPPLTPFKCAVFICGSPPLSLDSLEPVLKDEASDTITIPTVHILGSLDPGPGLALYDVCEPKTAIIFEHQKGHTIPWDFPSTNAMAKAIREVVSQCAGCLIGTRINIPRIHKPAAS